MDRLLQNDQTDDYIIDNDTHRTLYDSCHQSGPDCGIRVFQLQNFHSCRIGEYRNSVVARRNVVEWHWRDGRVVYGDGLENRYPVLRDREFESHSLRQKMI